MYFFSVCHDELKSISELLLFLYYAEAAYTPYFIALFFSEFFFDKKNQAEKRKICRQMTNV